MTNHQIRADIFPVVITLTKEGSEDVVYEKARVVVTLDHVYVFQDAQPIPAIVFDDRLTSYTPPLPSTRVRKSHMETDRSAKFETEDGYTASFSRMSGCGCGSRLKRATVASLLPDNTFTSAASTGDSA